MAPPVAIVFDAYGTLFDVHSVIEAGRAVTSDPTALSTLWRQKQLEYTWLRSLMGRYEDSWAVTEAALRFALRRLDIAASEAEIVRLMEAYLSLATFPEVAGALRTLAGTPLGILSNGSPMISSCPCGVRRGKTGTTSAPVSRAMRIAPGGSVVSRPKKVTGSPFWKKS